MKNTTEEILALLSDHGARLHALFIRLTLREDVAEDLMQELFLTLVQRHGFDRAKDPVAYAIRSATNLAFDWRRAQKRAPAKESSFDHQCADDQSPLSKLIEREQQQRVLETLGDLPKRSRDIVVMRYLQQQSYEEIGKNVPPSERFVPQGARSTSSSGRQSDLCTSRERRISR